MIFREKCQPKNLLTIIYNFAKCQLEILSPLKKISGTIRLPAGRECPAYTYLRNNLSNLI